MKLGLQDIERHTERVEQKEFEFIIKGGITMKKPSIAVSLSSVMTLSGYVTAIGNKRDIANVAFKIGKTDKSTVANTLGLPAYISKSEALGREYWAYHAKQELTRIIYAARNGAEIVRTYIFPTGQTWDYEYDGADVVYVFDRSGVLVGVHQPEREK